MNISVDATNNKRPLSQHERNSQSESKKRRKALKVSFNEGKNTVKYFDVEEIPHNKSEVESSEPGTTTSLRLTKEMTLLSTEHGRARRELRDISKYELKTAVKYGVKSRGRTVNGDKRWIFKFGNITFITDDTCTKEITSYRDPVVIQPAEITADMMIEHNNVQHTIQNKFELVTSHSIIIIDQSGSMRTCDVHGFKTRSDAAYGTIALDYIAEQLYARGTDVMIDAVTIIEMNDGGYILYDRVPLDWILFNNLLARQRTCKSKSHGNYNPCLMIVKELINEDLEKYNSIGIGEDDLPLYNVVLLSDGKPSDHLPPECLIRGQVMTEITRKLRNKLNFLCMGIGAKGTTFDELKRMVLIAKVSGASEESKFVHAGLSPAVMSSTLSSLAASTTATRTRLLSGESEKRPEKQFTMRGRWDSSNECPSTRYHGVTRFKYDPNIRSYPWRKVEFINNSATAFEIEDNPFGQGAERLAYRFFEITNEDGKWKRLGKFRVAKESKRISKDDESRKEIFHEQFCKVQLQANIYAKEFNTLVEKTKVLQPIDESELKLPKITFLKCSVYEYLKDGYTCGYLVENYLRGKYIKFSNNNGFEKGEIDSYPKVTIEMGEVPITDILHAFSHWVFYSTNQKMLVCDLQGILDMEGRVPQFLLTDPAINTQKRKHGFGRTDTGWRGIQAFCRSHKCNKVCEGLGLSPILSELRKTKFF